MDLDLAREFLRANHRAVLCTRRADGSPQLSPVVCAVDDAGRVVVSSREGAFKVRNLRRSGEVWLCGLSESFFGDWVQVTGMAEVLSLPDALEPLVDYYRRVAGEHDDWAAYRAAMVADARCLIRVTLSAAGPDRSG